MLEEFIPGVYQVAGSRRWLFTVEGLTDGHVRPRSDARMEILDVDSVAIDNRYPAPNYGFK